MNVRRLSMLVAYQVFLCATASAAELNLRPQEIFDKLTVGYATRILDMNDDGRPDILVVDSKRVIWFENPSWQMRTILEGQTLPDNVAIAPADIDGDGDTDFALAADWRPGDTHASGSLEWLERPADVNDTWKLHRIGVEPTIHRIRFADLDADGREELIVVPLFGRDSKSPQFAEAPIRVLAYEIPEDPIAGPWTPQVLNEDLHVAHNFLPTDCDHDGHLDVLVASFEGVSLLTRDAAGHWSRKLIGSGNQETSPSRGSSEIKLGHLASGSDYLATIEPWHGFQVVVYTPPASDGELWKRQVIDDELKWGHAVWCADLDDDADLELIIGVRDTKDAEHPCGLRIYDPAQSAADAWRGQRVDPGGVAIEDLAVGDLDGDGAQDAVAVGRQTHNVRIYWNETHAK